MPCTSKFQKLHGNQDTDTEECSSWCTETHAADHCEHCACRACQFCATRVVTARVREMGEACPPARDDDSDTMRCENFCKSSHEVEHCDLCKCKACDFCPKRGDTRAACAPAADDDAPTKRCEPFCALAHAAAHCELCKCQGCSFCPKSFVEAEPLLPLRPDPIVGTPASALGAVAKANAAADEAAAMQRVSVALGDATRRQCAWLKAAAWEKAAAGWRLRLSWGEWVAGGRATASLRGGGRLALDADDEVAKANQFAADVGGAFAAVDGVLTIELKPLPPSKKTPPSLYLAPTAQGKRAGAAPPTGTLEMSCAGGATATPPAAVAKATATPPPKEAPWAPPVDERASAGAAAAMEAAHEREVAAAAATRATDDDGRWPTAPSEPAASVGGDKVATLDTSRAAWVAAGLGALGLVFVVVCVCCASAGGSSAKGARVPLEDETAFGWEEQGEEEGEEEEGEAPARVELD